MDIKEFVEGWIKISNSYNTEKYLENYLKEAVLDDPSVGRKFAGHEGIKEYYTKYFIDYKTQTKLLTLDVKNNKAHLEVEFTGEFPGGRIRGMFDLTFKHGKIAEAKADLL